MVNGFGFYSNALRSIRDTYQPTKKPKSFYEELQEVGNVRVEKEEEDKISLVGYWVYSINPSAKMKDYIDVPLHELLEAFAVWSANRKYELEFHASINGAKLK